MKDINFVKDNGNMTDEYLDAEIICDNEDPNDCARIAHEVWDQVINNDNDTNDVGDSIWPQVLNVLQNKIHNGLDEDVALEVREIIWEDYVPTWENYVSTPNVAPEECPHKCGACIGTDEYGVGCMHGCHDCGHWDGSTCLNGACSHCGRDTCECAYDCKEWEGA